MTEARPARTRRTQAERTAETRNKLIQAAITCLHRTGYSATTISTVAKEADVSRGAMTHQFPAKTDLMLAVVQWVFDEDRRLYDESADNMNRVKWLIQLPNVMWDVISRPAGIAVMEIMLASRSDPELAARLRALQKTIDKDAHRWSAEHIEAAGVRPHAQTEAVHELFVAAVRGLALEATFMNDAAGVQSALRILSDMARLLFSQQDDIKERD